MFGKASNHSNTTIIGRGARLTGTLELEGDVLVEGQCEGRLLAQGQLSIGPSGSLRGELSASKVLVAGNVEGLVVARDVLHITKTGVVNGEAFYGELQIDPGGELDGKTQKGPHPTASSETLALNARNEPAIASDDNGHELDSDRS